MFSFKLGFIGFFWCCIVSTTMPVLSEPYPIFTTYLDAFPPYDLGINPPICKIQRLYKKGKKGLAFQAYSYFDNGNRHTILLEFGKTVKKTERDFFFSKVTVFKGKKPLMVDKVQDLGQPYTAVVFLSYLNQDNIKDIIIAYSTFSSAPPTYFVTFLLSDKDTYHVSRIHTHAISKKLFYDYNDDGKCEFLQLEMFNPYLISKKIPDYIVYNIMQFTKSSFKYNNKLSRYFPRWIAFETTQPGSNPVTNNKAIKLPKKITNLFWEQYLLTLNNYISAGEILDREPVKEQIKQIKQKNNGIIH